MTPDTGNAIFEGIGAAMCWANAGATWRDKKVAGVRWWATGFFAAWGFWNLYYYAALDQPFSWWMGVVLTAGNTVWVGLLYYYSRSKT